MARTRSVLGIALLVTMLAACTNQYDPGQRALGGGAIGAAAGAGLGGIAGGTGGAITGALIGGAVGALGGAATTPRAPQPSSAPASSRPYQY